MFLMVVVVRSEGVEFGWMCFFSQGRGGWELGRIAWLCVCVFWVGWCTSFLGRKWHQPRVEQGSACLLEFACLFDALLISLLFACLAGCLFRCFS